MDEDDLELRRRLLALEAAVPGAEAPAFARRRTRFGRLAFTMSTVSALVLSIAATATAGAVILGARGTEGVENPGQPLAGAQLECMTPPAAAAYLAARGFTQVTWQVERDGVRSTQTNTPPAHGYVVPGAIVDGTLLMVVDLRSGATGVGACFTMPTP